MSAHPTVALPPTQQPPFAVIEDRTRYTDPVRTPSRTGPRRKDWLSEALLEASPTRPQRRVKDVLISVALHSLVLVVVILVPLYATQTIDLKYFTTTLLVPPPPPPAPAPPATVITKPRSVPRRLLTDGKLLAPTVIPNKVVILKEAALPPEEGFAGGVPGGVPGGQLGGVLGGIISEASRTSVPLAPSTQPRSPLRVGGRVKAPRLLQQPPLIYPVLARQAKVQGVVSIDAVIDESGNVVEMRVLSGPPLLLQAALQAVSQWKYEPTYLNDKPVAVQLIVTVTFQLWT